MRIFSLFCLFLFIHIVTAYSQVSGYECDFEDDAHLSEWTLNAGPFGGRCTNKWYIGNAVNNGGKRSLYISYDEGSSAGYLGGDGNMESVSAYVTLNLPADNYELSFDWQALGMNNDGFYVCWVPEDVPTNSTDQTGTPPKYVTDYSVIVGGRKCLNNSLWNSVYGPFKSDGEPHKLVFVWNNSSSGAVSPAACIDNINIIPLSLCQKPKNITVTPNDTTITFSWGGLADSYDIRIKPRETNEWVEFYEHQENSITVGGLPEGVVEVYVRSNCGEFHSVWVSSVQFVYYSNLRCVDFLDINDANCYYGKADNPFKTPGKIDEGFESDISRHTIHYNSYETDPRTGGILKTVSDHDIASVRLGNWKNNAEGEGIIYDFEIEEGETQVLLVHYAVVLEDPNHDMEDQPRFYLEITDEYGNPIDEYGCGKADFSAGYNTGDDWSVYTPTGDNPTDVLYRDWSTIGINMSEYAGRRLKIRLATYDCKGGEHYGYAYFALSCTDGKLLGLSCGKSPASAFKAPDGFNYRWYRLSDPGQILSNDQTYSINALDTAMYACDVIQILNPNCYYTVYAKATPRYPVAEATYSATVKDCQNVVEFSDSSNVIYMDDDGTVIISPDEMCDSVTWDFGDGTYSSEWSPVHIFPTSGGVFTVRQKAFLAECDSITEYRIELPDLMYNPDTIYAYICQGESYPHEKYGDLYISGNYNDTVVSEVTGCDSVSVLNLTVLEDYFAEDYDTVCTDDLPYIYQGKEYYESSDIEATFESTHHCDSTVLMHLLVNTSLNVTFPDEVEACADDSVLLVPFEVTSGVVSSYDVLFTDVVMQDMNVIGGVPQDGALVIPVKSARPGIYDMTVRLENMDCGDDVHDMRIGLLYPDSILVQRWNDVIGVRNSGYNGGYSFSAYQWYVDGQIMAGEVNPTLYLPDGLVAGADYSIALTRSDDGVTVMTCPITANVWSEAEIDVTPTVTFRSETVSVKSSVAGTYRIWTVTGILVSSGELLSGETAIAAPDYAGTYLMELLLDDGTRTVEKIVVRNR